MVLPWAAVCEVLKEVVTLPSSEPLDVHFRGWVQPQSHETLQICTILELRRTLNASQKSIFEKELLKLATIFYSVFANALA